MSHQQTCLTKKTVSSFENTSQATFNDKRIRKKNHNTLPSNCNQTFNCDSVCHALALSATNVHVYPSVILSAANVSVCRALALPVTNVPVCPALIISTINVPVSRALALLAANVPVCPAVIWSATNVPVCRALSLSATNVPVCRVLALSAMNVPVCRAFALLPQTCLSVPHWPY